MKSKQLLLVVNGVKNIHSPKIVEVSTRSSCLHCERLSFVFCCQELDLSPPRSHRAHEEVQAAFAWLAIWNHGIFEEPRSKNAYTEMKAEQGGSQDRGREAESLKEFCAAAANKVVVEQQLQGNSMMQYDCRSMLIDVFLPGLHSKTILLIAHKAQWWN